MNLDQFKNGKELIQKAKDFATAKHEGQLRKFGNKPYIIHPAGVAKIVEDSGGTPEMIAAAWLHDVVEESGVSFVELREMFGDKVAGIVSELSNPSDLDKSKKGQYLLSKMNTMSSDALTVKLSDRLNNVLDFSTARPSFVQKYAGETMFIINGLEETERPINQQQSKLLTDIRKAIEPYVSD